MLLQLMYLGGHLWLHVGAQQKQHPQDPLVEQGFGDAGGRGLGDLERDPAGDDHLDGLAEIRQVFIADGDDAAFAQASEQRLHGGTELLLCLEVFLLQQLVATQDVRQIRVEEAELPHQIEDGIQVAHQILQPDLAAADRSEAVAQVAGVLIEDGVDDVFFVSEVVVKVARADAKVCGNVVGGDVALALIVEQLGGAVDDPVSGLHRWSLCRARRGKVIEVESPCGP